MGLNLMHVRRGFLTQAGLVLLVTAGFAAVKTAMPFGRVASNAPHWAPALLPEGEEPGLRETVFWTPENMDAPDEQDRINTSAAYGFAFDMCGVEVDRATGRVRIGQLFPLTTG